MLTPTGVTASAYWDAIRYGHPTHIRMTFTGQNVVADDSDIDINGGLILSDYLNSDNDLVMGKAVCKQITVSLLNSDKFDGLDWTGEFVLEMGVEIEGTTNWVTIGYFSGERPNNLNSAQVIDFVAYDRMKKFDVSGDEFVNSISYPATVKNIYDSLCTYIGLQNIAGNELPRILTRVYSYPPYDMRGYTCRDILAWIAEACGCYAKITADGKVKMVWYVENNDYAITGDDEFSVECTDTGGMVWNDVDLLTWNEFDDVIWNDASGFGDECRINQIVATQLDDNTDVVYPTGGMNTNVYRIVGNPFLLFSAYDEVEAYLVPIYMRVFSFDRYFSARISTVGNWLVEAGDIVQFDVHDLRLGIPVFMKTLHWNGATNDDFETTVQNSRDVYKSQATKQLALTSKGINDTKRQIRIELTDEFYEKHTGIVIDEDGVDITGDKFVNIHSGGQFTVDSNGFSVDSENRKIRIGGVEVDDEGLHNWDDETDVSTGSEFIVGASGVSRTGNHAIVTLSGYAAQNGTDKELLIANFTFAGTNCPSEDDASKLLIICDYDKTTDGSPMNIELNATNGSLGNQYNRWDVYAKTVSYNSLSANSSRDVKHDITPMPSVGETIDKLKPVTFIYDDDAQERVRTGLIYEDTIGVLPEICSQDETNKTLNYMDLVPMLLKEIQDLRKRVEELERR